MVDAIDDVRRSDSTDSSVSFSATNSATPTRSCWWSSAGLNLWADASVIASQAGWSVRSLSRSVRTKATRSATDSKAKRSSSPRNASHSSPASRQRGAHSVYTSPFGQPEPDRHDVSSHAAQPNHRVRRRNHRAGVLAGPSHPARLRVLFDDQDAERLRRHPGDRLGQLQRHQRPAAIDGGLGVAARRSRPSEQAGQLVVGPAHGG